jgi:hypothetical protein
MSRRSVYRTAHRWVYRSTLGGMLLLCLAFAASCTQKTSSDEVLIQIPTAFSGEVRIEMGVVGAPPLKGAGGSYVVSLPADGHVETSTVLGGLRPRFQDVDAGRIWGYSPSIWKTGDGIPVGGNIEFFVGTKEQYETQEAKKHKSQFAEADTGNTGE